MAQSEYSVKKITTLEANTEAVDNDLLVVGNNGTAIMKKLTFANLANSIRDKLKSLTFTGTGGLNTTNKTLPGAINELNTNKVNIAGDATAGQIMAVSSAEQYVDIRATSSLGTYTLIAGPNSFALYDNTNNVVKDSIAWNTNSMIASGLMYRGTTLADANTVNLTPGIYRIGAAESVANVPSDFAYGVLVVYPGGYNTQMLINYNKIYIRDYTGNPAHWGTWRKILGEDKAGTFTPASGQSMTNGLIVQQYGRVVTVWGYLNNVSIPSASSTVIGKFSGVSIPSNGVRVVGSVGVNAYSMGTPSYLVIGADGNLSVVTTNTGTNKAIFFNATWIA